MSEHPAVDHDRLPDAVAQLVTSFEQLGAEHRALVVEAEKTTAKERRGTVNRMAECVAQAGFTLSHTVNMLATVHGLNVLGIGRQFSKDADGRDYIPLISLGHPSETLYEAGAISRLSPTPWARRTRRPVSTPLWPGPDALGRWGRP